MRGTGAELARHWPLEVERRFELRAHIGAGGFGDVYEAFDRELEMPVALKTLRSPHASASAHLKREFRALADVAHPNLLTLYELFITPEHSFFTMELVRGESFLSHVRGPALGSVSDVRSVGGHDFGETLPPSSARTSTPLPTVRSDDGPANVPALGCDEERVRVALLQVVRGVSALHTAGKLHRDIKPSNVLVDGDGRVLVSDFGLVASSATGLQGGFAGTPTYAAPEQALGDASPASDWYSVGCMLFEALTGQRVFAGEPLQVLAAKQQFEPPRICGSDLGELCARLLARDADARPSGAAIIAALARTEAEAVPVKRMVGGFVGREHELGVLSQAVRQQGGTAVEIIAPSGIGKSALLAHLRERFTEATWLDACCSERETMPYNAIDGWVDALTEHLLGWTDADVAAVLPAELWALVRIFPSLRRLSKTPIHEPPRRDDDGDHTRTAAFDGLRTLISRVAERGTTIAVVDDAQWADRDSRLLLRELFESAPPPLTLVLASRVHTIDLPGMRQIALAELPASDAARLAAQLLGGAPEDARAQTIVREAGGHPLFIRELAQADGGTANDLDTALWRRVQDLDAAARNVATLLAIAGEALPSAVVRSATALEPSEHERAARQLCVEGLARRSSDRGHASLEAHHDRVRVAVVKNLKAPALRTIHARLATALISSGADVARPRLVMFHLEAAGDRQQAGVFAERAALQADAALAFDNAAELYAAALRLRSFGPEHNYTLTRRLADALRAAGRGAEAARAYLSIADEGELADRWLCRQRAGEQLLTSGRIHEGIAALDELLHHLGEPLPVSNAHALWLLAKERLSLRRRGYGWQEQPNDGASRHDLRRLDVLRSVAFGLGVVDNLRGAVYSARALRLALDLGVPALVAEALGTQAIFEGSQTTASRVRARHLLTRVADIAATHDDPSIGAWLASGEAILDAFDGVPDAPARMKVAADVFAEKTIGNTWNTNSLKVIRALTLRLRGDFVGLRAIFDDGLREARRQNNRYMECNIRHGGTLLFLAADDIAGARNNHDATSWGDARQTMHVQHFLELESTCFIALYERQGGRAFRAHRAQLVRMFTSLVMRLQRVRVIGHWLCGTLACADGARWARPIAAHCAARLAKEGVPYANVFAQLLRVSMALRWGSDAETELSRLQALATTLGWPLYAGLARFISASRRGDHTESRAASEQLRVVGVASAPRLSALYVPSSLD